MFWLTWGWWLGLQNVVNRRKFLVSVDHTLNFVGWDSMAVLLCTDLSIPCPVSFRCLDINLVAELLCHFDILCHLPQPYICVVDNDKGHSILQSLIRPVLIFLVILSNFGPIKLILPIDLEEIIS